MNNDFSNINFGIQAVYVPREIWNFKDPRIQHLNEASLFSPQMMLGRFDSLKGYYDYFDLLIGDFNRCECEECSKTSNERLKAINELIAEFDEHRELYKILAMYYLHKGLLVETGTSNDTPESKGLWGYEIYCKGWDNLHGEADKYSTSFDAFLAATNWINNQKFPPDRFEPMTYEDVPREI
ncbi:hypothetical protein NIES25_44020 [Nostoc linckia NIES-25]|nr:hypothetical protein NIES25_44020 [Nostoc linckia NIES-25]